MKIIYDDKDIIVCVKPYGLLSQGDNKGNTNAVDVLKGITNSEIYPIHRLDKTTGGVMVFAKNQKSAAALSAQITDGRFNKEYLAVVGGVPKENAGELLDLLYFDRAKNKSYVVKRKRSGVKEARLYYQTLDTKKIKESDCSLLKIKLFTGRTHQIRVQFASRGLSLVGDRRYGSQMEATDIALWSYNLSFYHPVSNEPLSFNEPPQNSIFEYFEI
ncbi:MAG: RluA family pseudouridine synthase [Clostridia bacterium]|nr:RluA family pseudouridine synthase [Clostridia bacterium]